jgi:uncharacterized protein
MDTIRLFDVQAGFGGVPKGKIGAVGPDEIVEEMQRLEIARALVRTLPDELIHDVPSANETLFKACRQHSMLVPCPILIPNGGRDLPSEADQVAEAIERNAGAAFVRPEADYWNTEEWACGNLLSALENRRLPAFCHTNKLSLDTIADLAGRYPGLPFIAAGISYRSHRILVPLLKAFRNVHMSIGNPYTVHNGIEFLAKEIGPERLLFGTGFPDAEAMPAVTQLLYADVSAEAKELIGSGNMERLTGDVER